MRSTTFRSNKYGKKLDSTVIKNRAASYGKAQKSQFSLAVGEQARIETEVRKMAGNVSGNFAIMPYMVFAKTLVSMKKKHSGMTLLVEADLLWDLWQKRGLNGQTLNTILTHYIPGWQSPPGPDVFTMDVSLLDGPDGLAP